jgi:DUF2934 family protein
MTHREKSISERAYEIWDSEGRPEGRDAEHWEQASAELAAIRNEKGAAPSQEADAKATGGKKAKTGPGARASKTGSKAKDTAPAKDSGASTVDRNVSVLGAKPSKSRKRTPS